ncbi:MAG: hypothetical protein MK105_08305 [Crocinitomicaceae bacterium]|nr:hypothetical protein [Crocinitomicaceae bacterium]
MLKEFFQDKFEYDFRSNKNWCRTILSQEQDIPEYVVKMMSHIVNVHHIWIYRVLGLPPESFSWDKLPIDYWEKLHQENYLKTIDYLEKNETYEKVNYHSEEGVIFTKETIDILYHILNHSNYHRGQIAKSLRDHGLEPPVFNFITFR